MAGGNAALDVLTGGGVAAPVTPAAAIGSQVPAGGAASYGVANSSGGQTTLPRIQFTICGLFLLAVAALVLLNKAGFKFAITVGGR